MDLTSFTEVSLDFRVTLLTGMHIGSGFGRGKALDDLMVQMPHPETRKLLPCITGSTLKGAISERAPVLMSARGLSTEDYDALHARLFGTGKQPGMLTFRYAHLDDTIAEAARRLDDSARSALTHERTFVSLSRQRRVALAGRLFRIDIADADLVFTGSIRGQLPGDAASDLTWLAAAMRLVTHLGGHKSRGLGRCRIDIDASSPALVPWDAWLGVEAG
jgi:CRISPR/Cas system CSM-associated protein Csm3 (group 7 of RAMP superfamily)